jgi:uncharacterized protein (TIGR02145 family)
MHNSIRLLTFSVLYTLNFIAFSQTNNGDASIIMSGRGLTVEDAKQVALLNCIQKAYGVFISSRTDIFNNEMISEQITSVSSGNITSFDILDDSELPDGSWVVTLRATVSIDKLASFVEEKGYKVDFKGGLFAVNIKQQLLNEQSETDAVASMVGLLHEVMQTAFDFEINSENPILVSSEKEIWGIPLKVIVTSNKNMDFCADYFLKTIAAVSLSSEEAQSYITLNKPIFQINFKAKGTEYTFTFRKTASVKILGDFFENWDYFMSLFEISAEIGKWYGKNLFAEIKFENEFPVSGEVAGIFKGQVQRNLNEISKITGFSVRPLGVCSRIINGGYIVYRNRLPLLSISIFDLSDSYYSGASDNLSWNQSKDYCEKLTLQGVTDWRLPSIYELDLIFNENKFNFDGDFSLLRAKYSSGRAALLSSTQIDDDDALISYETFQTDDDGNSLVLLPKINEWSPAYSGHARCVKSFKHDSVLIRRDFKEIEINGQVWMNKNLNVLTFTNGDTIYEAKSNEDWNRAFELGKPAWCFYFNDSSHDTILGELYNVHAVNDSRGLAPIGWHIPSNEEWKLLINNLGGNPGALKKLGSINGYVNSNYTRKGSGNNSSGFSGFPCGRRNSTKFEDFGRIGYWWSSTKYNHRDYASSNEYNGNYFFKLYTRSVETLIPLNYTYGNDGFYVRCVKDEQ